MRTSMLLLAGLALAACTPAGPVSAALASTGGIYSLGSLSDQEIGCFGPCACPVLIRSPMEGTFRLIPAGVVGGEERFDVRDVDWSVDTQDGALHVTGAGSYLRRPDEHRERMILDLSLDGGDPLRFDSDWDTIPPGSGTSGIEVVISRHQHFCWDSLFTISAAEKVAGVPNSRAAFRLEAARPSPFRDRVDLAFTLSSADRIELAVFEASGRRVRTLVSDSWQAAGPHAVTWDGTDDRGRPVAVGVLFARLRTSAGTARTTLVRIR